MRNPEIRLFANELIVDNFAGGGGASTGIEMATGRSPDIAINHDPQAVAMHEANHPSTRHYVEDVWKVDPIKVCAGRPVGLAWFSPDCKHFSKAKGGKPVSKKIRGLAWIVVKWAKLVRPRVIMLENVEEFQDWGPLGDDDRPDRLRKGETFKRWKAQLENLGYQVDCRELVAADFGAPTTRKRLFLVARCDGLPISWPEKTHDKLGRNGLQKWRAAAECIDWSIPCPSIFLTSEEARAIGVKRPLAENTMRRIHRGLMKFVIHNPKPFIVPVMHGAEARVWDIDEPMRTITGAHRGDRALVAPLITKFRGDSAGSPIDAPLPTITAGPKERPAGAAHAMAMTAAYVTRIGQTGGGDQSRSADDPLSTVVSKAEHLVVTPYLAGVGGRKGQSPETGVEQPYHTITAKADTVLVAPTLIQTGYGEREGQAPRAPGLDKPLGTVVGSGKHGLVAAFLAQHNGGFYDERGGAGRAVDVPMSTITQAGSNQQIVQAAFGVKLKGTSKDGQQLDLPLATVAAEGKHHAATAFMVAYYGNDKDGQHIEDPMRTVTAHDRLGLVMVEGDLYAIVDIGMRMLVPRELYRAQGFADSYKIDFKFNGKPLPKDAQVRMCGNSVSPYPCAALVACNFADVPAEVAA